MKRSHRVYDVIKRAGDLTVSALLLVLLSPVLAATAVAVRVALGSPVLFSQERPGRNGAPFTLRKFRSMAEAHPSESDIDAVATDASRLTPFGRWLRASSLDELPGLLNVLRGEMSLVGPRPLLMEYLGRYSPEQARRHEVRPGITGWAQVNGRNAVPWDERLALDVWYVDNRSLLLDLRILGMTFARLFTRAGVTGGNHATMEPFNPGGGDAPARKEET